MKIETIGLGKGLAIPKNQYDEEVLKHNLKLTKEKKLREIYNNLNENEKFGLSFGLFLVKLIDLDNHESAELIRISQEESKVVY